MGIERNISTDRLVKIPSLQEIENRFFDINTIISVNIDHCGYLAEVKGYAPFKGKISVQTAINLLNKDINVIVNDDDIVKLRNSIIFYNEYFCPSKDNTSEAIPALVAFERVESKYVRTFGVKESEGLSKNPFYNNILQDICVNEEYNVGKTDLDDAMARYIAERKKERDAIKTSNKTSFNKEPVAKPKVVSMHSTFCKNIPNHISFNGFEDTFEDCEFESMNDE